MPPIVSSILPIRSIIVQEVLCERSLGEDSDLPENIPRSHINQAGLAIILTAIPPKPVCDALVEFFAINVHTVHPMVHWATLQIDYNNFWQWCRNSDISQPTNKLLGDPTFLCLLFSIFYCGALTAPPAHWSSEPLKGYPQEKLLGELENVYSKSIMMCQASDFPTLYTLTASLLVHSCARSDPSAIDDLRFVGSSFRIAQLMGLHRDGAELGLDLVESEMRRRVWWHVVWIDGQTSLLHGFPSAFGANRATCNVAMVSDTKHEAFHWPSSIARTLISTTMLLAIGRSELAKFKHILINTLEGGGHQKQPQLNAIMGAAKSLQQTLDKLILKTPSQGISETGFLPTRLQSASPFTHPGLYQDNPSSPTIRSSWTKVLLDLIKAEVVILVQKPFLNPPDERSQQQQRVWNR